MNDTNTNSLKATRKEGSSKRSKEVDHRAVNIAYRRAIIRAIDELQDFSLRSNIDAIRRHVKSSDWRQQQDSGGKEPWNEVLFMQTIKALTSEGDIEQCTTANCGFSPEFKERRVKSMKSLLEKRAEVQQQQVQQQQQQHHHHHYEYHEKILPTRKQEHAKLKIIPKRIYDSLHVPIKNPMDTH